MTPPSSPDVLYDLDTFPLVDHDEDSDAPERWPVGPGTVRELRFVAQDDASSRSRYERGSRAIIR